MTARIYDRPDHDQQRGRLPLRITGTLPNSAPFVAYENRLQIHNAIGACRAELFAGDLPAGYTISVDNETQEIIVAWPAWEPVAQPVFNGDFEMGDVGWEKGAGWAVRHNPPEPKYTGNWAAIFTGGGTSSIMCVPQPCGPGRSISGGVLFDQGSSNKKNVDCYVQLSFYDVSGKVIGNPVWGNKVHKLTNKQRHWSRVTHTSPPQTAAVSIGAMVHRRRYLRPVSADDIYWNLEGSGVGAPEDATYEITIRAFDSTGRSAIWSGSVTIKSGASGPDWYIMASGGSVPYFVPAGEFADAVGFSESGSPFDRLESIADDWVFAYAAGVTARRINKATGEVLEIAGSSAFTGRGTIGRGAGNRIWIPNSSEVATSYSDDFGATATIYPGMTANAFVGTDQFVLRIAGGYGEYRYLPTGSSDWLSADSIGYLEQSAIRCASSRDRNVVAVCGPNISGHPQISEWKINVASSHVLVANPSVAVIAVGAFGAGWMVATTLGIHYAQNVGGVWSSSLIFPQALIRDMSVSGGQVIVTTSSTIYLSTDGATFNAIDRGAVLPSFWGVTGFNEPAP